MKVLLIGSKGMLGSELAQVFQDQKLTTWDVEDVNIVDKGRTISKIKGAKPDVIINAAAYTAVDDCEENQETAMRVNGEGPGNLAQAAKMADAVLVHYSTDYIFNGQEQDGYDEKYDQIDPINVYGESKALGEKLIKESGCKYYIIRTAWLYGKNGNNFVDTMVKLSQEKDKLKVVDDQRGCPTYAVDLANKTKEIIDSQEPFGVFHVTNSGECSWYEFAKEIFRLKNIDIKLEPCTSAEFPRPAKRPAYSVLINTKTGPLRPWQEALKEYLS